MIRTFDVVVIGGGTAGSAAAVAAGRRGHRVLLVEELNCLGGISTAGGVHEWFAGTSGLGDIFDHVRTELTNYGARFGRFFNGEYAKIIWQLLADRSGVEVLFHSTLAGVVREGGEVRAVRLLSCGQEMEIRAKYFIDASGEGDLAAGAGAEFERGDPEHGRTLHMTLTFLLVESRRPVVPYLPEGLEPIQSREELPGLGTGTPTPDGRVYCNATKVVGLDPTDPLQLSGAEAEARRQIARILHFLNRTDFPNHILASSGAKIGVREGRRIRGEYRIRGEDVVEGKCRNHPDGIAVATCQIDFHSLTKAGSAGWRQKVAPYQIPYRALIPQGLRNVLVAGKCISGDQVAMSSYRMTPTCCAMGQAAGTAAALAMEAECADVREVDVPRLQAELVSAAAVLDPDGHHAFGTHQTPRSDLEESDAQPVA